MSDDDAFDDCPVILLVEDSDTDVFLTREAFDRCGARVSIQHVDNGEKCMAYLRQQAPFASARMPDLVLLDLNLPVMDGREVLRALEDDPTVPPVPVIVLSTSCSPADVAAAYARGCASYVAKPLDIDRFDQIIGDMWNYWFGVVTLPTGKS